MFDAIKMAIKKETASGEISTVVVLL